MGGVEGALGLAALEDGVSDELGMALPLEHVLADAARIVGGVGLGMGGAMAVEEIDEMGPVGGAVAGDGVLDLLQREVDGPARRLGHREGPRVELVGEAVALGVVLDRGHGASAGESRHA